MKGYSPGLRVYRRINQELFFHPVTMPNEKTVIRLKEASTDGVKILVISPSGETDEEEMVPGDSITFGSKNFECVLVLDESMAGHGSFRVLAGPEVLVRRVDNKKGE